MHLSGVPKVLYNTVLWLCECSGLESALPLKCLVSRYLYHILKSVLPCHYSCFLIKYHFCGCSSDNGIQESNDPQLINRTPFVVTYNPMLPNLHKIFKDLQPCLSSSERCAEAFQNTPLISYRRARNLSDMLCSKRLPPSTNRRPTSTTPENDTSLSENTCPECGLQCKNPKGLKIYRSSKHKKQSNKPITPGFWPCKSDPRCAICKEGHFSTSITSHHNSKTHNIKQPVTCKSNNVCYLIDCSKCKQQYVGETELEFHCRMSNHKSDI